MPDQLAQGRTAAKAAVHSVQSVIYGRENVDWRRLVQSNMKAEQVNRLWFRVPIELRPGFGLTKGSLNGIGELPVGNTPAFKEMFFAYQTFIYTVDLQKEATILTESKKSSAINLKKAALLGMPANASEVNSIFFSTDGSAEWIKPWTWFTAARWDRIGGTF